MKDVKQLLKIAEREKLEQGKQIEAEFLAGVHDYIATLQAQADKLAVAWEEWKEKMDKQDEAAKRLHQDTRKD